LWAAVAQILPVAVKATETDWFYRARNIADGNANCELAGGSDLCGIRIPSYPMVY
jgi:hypothetical protein